jgi:hypothetical protein
MSCKIRTIGSPAWWPPTHSGAPAYRGTALSVKKTAARKGGMQLAFYGAPFGRYYSKSSNGTKGAAQEGGICAYGFATFPPHLPGYTDRPAMIFLAARRLPRTLFRRVPLKTAIGFARELR